MNRTGVRYITEEFIKIIAHEDHIDRIKKLNLDCGKGDKKIRYIEHLDNLNSIVVLSIRFNAIEKIEKLDKLCNLRELYLSENKITKLDGLENLLNLKILDVRGNQITSIPHWFTRRCKYLTKINFSRNMFDSVEEISKLWALKDLLDLDVSENPVAAMAHYRLYIVMRLKCLQILDNREVLADERKIAIEQFEENELDKMSSRLLETEKQLEQMKESQLKLQKEYAKQDQYQKDLNKKQKSNIEQIKQLEENLQSKDTLLKKKSEDLFRACQKYYELEQDIAFIKIDAKFDLLSNHIGPLDEPDNVSEHSQISSTGDQAYMGKGQFITKKEAEMLMERKRMKQSHLKNEHGENNGRNSTQKLKEDFVDSLNEKVKEKLTELNKINKEISEKNKIVDNLNNDIDHKELFYDSNTPTKSLIPHLHRADRPRSALASFNRLSPLRTLLNRPRRLSETEAISKRNDHSNITDLFLEKVENLTEMQREAEELRRQMESTEKESNRQQKDIEFLRNQFEKFKVADPNLANHIENEMKEKELHVDENLKLYDNLSKRLDQLSLAIEKSMNDIKEIEGKLLEENLFFTNDMRDKINTALSQLTQSVPNRIHQDFKKVLDKCKQAEFENQKLQQKIFDQSKEIGVLQQQLQNDGALSSRRSARSIDDEVDILRKELNRLRQDAMAAKDDLESEIEMEKVLNDELQKQIEELKQNEGKLTENLEFLQSKHGKLIDQTKEDNYLMKEAIEREMMNFQDNVLHRIKIAASENQIKHLEKSKNPIDKALLNLIKSTTIDEKPPDTSLDPEISKITEDLDHIKIQLTDINRKVSIASTITPLESSIDPRVFLKENDSQILPIKMMLSKSNQIYNSEINDMKSKIKSLQDSLNKAMKTRKLQNKNKPSTKIKFLPKMSKETLCDLSSSEDFQPTPKVRAHSQDRIQKRFKSETPTAKKWSSVQQNISSDEQRVFDAIQDELQELIKHLNLAEFRNNQRIEEAMNRLSDFEREYQSSHDDRFSKEKYENMDQEKENLEEFLRETMSRVERCQDDIRHLNDRLGSSIRNRKLDNDSNSYALEMKKMTEILQTQKAEIERLNNILENLTKSVPANNPQFVQQSMPPNNPPFPGPAYIPNGFLPQMYNSHSTPILNAVPYSSIVTSEMKTAGSLFCNVPEHHYLEDYFQNNGKHKSSWKLTQKFKSDSEKYMMTLDSLKNDIHRRTEDLDNVEIQISKQTNEIGRLNYQIDQLNYTKQDLLNNISSLRQETEFVTRETIASTSESLGHMRARKSQLTGEINKMDSLIRDKKDELFRTDSELKNSRIHFSQIQEQTNDTLKKHDEARMNHRKIIIECEELEKKSREASLELAKAMNELNTIQNETSKLTSNKMNLEEVLVKIQAIINQKDHDFQKINEEISRATQQLNSLKSDLNMATEQNREKMQMVSEGDRLLADTRLELNRLKNEVVLSQEHLQKMESEIGERNAAIDIANSELERSRQVHNRLIQECQNDQSRIKREFSDIKFELENLKDEKNDLLCTIENSKMKNTQIKEIIDKQEQAQMVLQSELDKLNCQTQHIDSMLRMKQGQLDKILVEYQARLVDLEKIDEETHKQHMESKKLDADIKRKATEIDKIRQTIAIDSEGLQRLQFDKESIEMSISTLSKEKSILQNEKKELESNLKILRKQESQVHETLTSLEAKVSQSRTELEKMHSEKCSETIKRDELKTQSNCVSKQLHESKCELQSIKERLLMIEAQCDERTSEIRKKMQLQSNLNIEIRKLQDQIRLANISFDEINSEGQRKKEKLNGLDNEITKKNDEIKLLEKKIYDLQNNVSKEDNKLEKILKNSSVELAQLKSEITEKLENLEATGNKLHQLKKDVAIKEFTEQKIYELEEIIKQQESNVHQYEQENRKLSNHLSVINRDLVALRQSHQFEMDSKDKELSRLRKRVSKEIFQLEKLAEEQCNRANSLSDDLNQARRDYMLLRNRIVIFGRFLDKESTCLAQEHFIEQQNLFKEYMQPNNSRLASNWENNAKAPGNDLPIGVESAILAEHQRHLQNQLNLLKDNITSATQASQNAQYSFDTLSGNKVFDNNLKWNTGSSGLGSTLDHTGNSLDTFENEKLKKVLHSQFNDDIEKINSENNKCEIRCHKLRTEIDHLKSDLPSDKSPLSQSD